MDKQNKAYSYSGILVGYRKNEVLVCATTWMNTENMLSERSQTQKVHMIPLI